MYYYITSHKGFWRSGGLGYTQDKQGAGIFSIYDFDGLNLDGCTLVSASSIAYNFQKIKIQSEGSLLVGNSDDFDIPYPTGCDLCSVASGCDDSCL